MCGIGGVYWRNRKVEPWDLQTMVKNLQHRGPDGSNIHIDHKQNIGLIHTRLSIIDLETGNQPMRNSDGKLYITYNGELYNFRELRKELESLGSVFVTHSDTEVVLLSYERWGKDCVKRFRGMFAFCIIDYNKQQFFLARDHFGIKPLYYHLNDTEFIFSSEIQAIVNLDVSLTLDVRAIDYYLWLQYVPSPFTAFQEIRKLPPANSLTLSFDFKRFETELYWDLKYDYNFKVSKAEWMERLESTIEKSVRAHLVSDVPFGAFLSGGLDSTMVVDCMQRSLDAPVKTFTIGFKEDEFSELNYASYVSKKLGTEHHHEIVEPDALNILPELVKHYGEPFGDSSAIPTFYVSRLARSYVPMVLSGDGGDEAFLGYQSYHNWMKYIKYDGVSLSKRPIHPLMSKFFPAHYPNRKDYHGWMEVMRYLPYRIRKKLWKSEVLHNVSWQNDEFETFFKKVDTGHLISKSQYTDLKTYLPDDILTKVDRASMIHGLEVRTPLIDIEVWNLISCIPPSFNFNDKGGKLLLKEILMNSYSEEFVNRPKQGFAIPLDKWLAGEKIPERVAALTYSTALIADLFNQETIKSLVKNRNGKWIWVLLVLEEWLRQFKIKEKQRF